MEIFDPIHGSINICDNANKIIDTEEFQRLRNIKQLGYCYYIFPGASHNRFEHSVGVYYLSKKYIHILNKNHKFFNEKETLLISIAALIHDIGHGPFSHLFDELTNSNHELRSIELFKYINTKYNLNYTDDDINFISDIINPINIEDKSKPYLYQIVSNPNGMDVDRMDYIMRDTYMIGLNYGIEYERIMKGSIIINNNITFSEKVRTPVEDFYRVRNNLYKDIYNHHAVRSIEYMIKEILTLCDNKLNIINIIKDNDWDNFINLNDNLIEYINSNYIKSDDNIIKAKKIIKNIKSRRLYKLCGELITNQKIIYPNFNNIIKNKNVFIDESIITYYNNSKPEFINKYNKHTLNISNNNTIEYHYKIFNKQNNINDKEKLTIYNTFINTINDIIS